MFLLRPYQGTVHFSMTFQDWHQKRPRMDQYPANYGHLQYMYVISRPILTIYQAHHLACILFSLLLVQASLINRSIAGQWL